jgi:phage gp37-like protein
MPGFEFFVGGIEDGIIELLTSLLSVKADPPGYLKNIASYGGELDESTLKKFVEQLAPRFPLMLVCYGDGDDRLLPATSPALDAPRIWQHNCTFTVIACSDDARGDSAQRRGTEAKPGVYKMIEDARELLAGRRFRRAIGNEQVLLTLEPLRPAGVEYLARLPQLTAYAQHFDTYFKWTEPDRRAAPRPVDDLIFDVTPLNAETEPGGLPGTVLEIN